jgi:GTPase SAR1 family protein
MWITIDIAFIETSALDSTNVEKAFVKVIHDIYHQTIKENQQDFDAQQNQDYGETSSMRG